MKQIITLFVCSLMTVSSLFSMDDERLIIPDPIPAKQELKGRVFAVKFPSQDQLVLKLAVNQKYEQLLQLPRRMQMNDERDGNFMIEPENPCCRCTCCGGYECLCCPLPLTDDLFIGPAISTGISSVVCLCLKCFCGSMQFKQACSMTGNYCSSADCGKWWFPTDFSSCVDCCNSDAACENFFNITNWTTSIGTIGCCASSCVLHGGYCIAPRSRPQQIEMN